MTAMTRSRTAGAADRDGYGGDRGKIAMREHHGLGIARRSRRIDHHCNLIASFIRDMLRVGGKVTEKRQGADAGQQNLFCAIAIGVGCCVG